MRRITGIRGAFLMSNSRVVTLAELPGLVGERLGPTDPIPITQEQVNAFADATHDQQWIHTDPVKAADGPFGGTIAHGFLTLALQPSMLFEALEVSDADSVVNYGLNKARFVSPVKVGAELVGQSEVTEVSEVRGGYQVITSVTIGEPGASKPACVAEVVFRYLGGKEV